MNEKPSEAKVKPTRQATKSKPAKQPLRTSQVTKDNLRTALVRQGYCIGERLGAQFSVWCDARAHALRLWGRARPVESDADRLWVGILTELGAVLICGAGQVVAAVAPTAATLLVEAGWTRMEGGALTRS